MRSTDITFAVQVIKVKGNYQWEMMALTGKITFNKLELIGQVSIM